MKKLIKNIEQWSIDRELHVQSPYAQYNKLLEEVDEIGKALKKDGVDMPELMDGIGDTFVVLTILAQQTGVHIEDCVKLAYNTIKNRTGKLVNGVFVKDGD